MTIWHRIPLYAVLWLALFLYLTGCTTMATERYQNNLEWGVVVDG